MKSPTNTGFTDEVMQSEKTAEFLADQIGDVRTLAKSFSSLVLMFSYTPEELALAISSLPAISETIEEEASRDEVMALVWSRAQQGMAIAAAQKAVEEIDKLMIATMFPTHRK
jgi:hypothetical protein